MFWRRCYNRTLLQRILHERNIPSPPTDVSSCTALSYFTQHASVYPTLPSLLKRVNPEQRQLIDIIWRWAITTAFDPLHTQPLRLFLSGHGGTGKTHAVRAIYSVVNAVLG
eukprot:PhF_6_TR35991/c0_g1_i2/m.52125